MKRTEALEAFTGFFQLYALADEVYDIDSRTNLVNLTSQCDPTLGLACGDHDTGHYLRLIGTKSRQSERHLVSHKESDHDAVAVDLIAVRLVVLLNQLGERGTEGDAACRLDSGVGEADCLDLHNSVGPVENEAVLGTVSVVDPSRIEDASAGTGISNASATGSATASTAAVTGHRCRRGCHTARCAGSLKERVTKIAWIVGCHSRATGCRSSSGGNATRATRTASSATSRAAATAARADCISAAADRLNLVRGAVNADDSDACVVQLNADQAGLRAASLLRNSLRSSAHDDDYTQGR